MATNGSMELHRRCGIHDVQCSLLSIDHGISLEGAETFKTHDFYKLQHEML